MLLPFVISLKIYFVAENLVLWARIFTIQLNNYSSRFKSINNYPVFKNFYHDLDDLISLEPYVVFK